jgi:DNA-binding NtrC family response regulator
MQPRAARTAAALEASVAPPDLADMIGRASYRQIHTAVDRWYVNSVANEERHNVSRVARRLRVSRKRVRGLWARLRSTRGQEDLHKSKRRLGQPSSAPPPPSLAPLLPHGTYREVHDAVDRWLLGHTLTSVGGNLSQAARELAVSRKHLRDHLARVKIAL